MRSAARASAGAALGLAAAALVLGGCSAAPGEPPGAARVDVDTPELRQAKDRAGVEPCPEVEADPVSGGLPDVTLPCFGGGPDVPISGLRGPLVVNVWASWCGPCREEMPILQEFHERYGDRVPILGIDYEDVQTGAAMQLVEDSGVTYPLLADPQSALRGADPFRARMGLPVFAFVDADGEAEVRAASIGSLADLEALVEEQLGVSL